MSSQCRAVYGPWDDRKRCQHDSKHVRPYGGRPVAVCRIHSKSRLEQVDGTFNPGVITPEMLKAAAAIYLSASIAHQQQAADHAYWAADNAARAQQCQTLAEWYRRERGDPWEAPTLLDVDVAETGDDS